MSKHAAPSTVGSMLSARAAKAYVGAAIAGMAAAVPLVDDGLTWGEGLGVAGAVLVAFQGIYWTSNQRTEGDADAG